MPTFIGNASHCPSLMIARCACTWYSTLMSGAQVRPSTGVPVPPVEVVPFGQNDEPTTPPKTSVIGFGSNGGGSVQV
ncbi:hypothetical protein OKW28_003159 [Paraburkholderia sp. 40]